MMFNRRQQHQQISTHNAGRSSAPRSDHRCLQRSGLRIAIFLAICTALFVWFTWRDNLVLSESPASPRSSILSSSIDNSLTPIPPSDRAPFYSRDEIFYKLDGGCTDSKGYFWAEGFFLAIDGFRQNPVGAYWDTMWVCNQRGFSIGTWTSLNGRSINMFPNVFKITNDKSQVCGHMRTFWGYETGGSFAKHYLPCYNIPSHSAQLEAEFSASPTLAWVQKPAAATGGGGVRIVEAKEVETKSNNYVQYYVNNPLLVNKRKFDVRLFVLVASVDPLVVFMHQNAYIRFSMVDYDPDPSKFGDKTMHVTNTHHQRQQPGYKSKESRYDQAKDHNPWSLLELMQFLEEHASEYGGVSSTQIWESMKSAVVDALLALREPLAATPCDGCYQVFGADVIIDENFKSYMIEWNTTPDIERVAPNQGGVMLLPVYADTFRLMNIQPRLVPVDCQRVRRALVNIHDGAVDEELLKLLCSHIHMFYYRGGFDLAWPAANKASSYESSLYTHEVYPLFRSFIAAHRDLTPFFKERRNEFFANP